MTNEQKLLWMATLLLAQGAAEAVPVTVTEPAPGAAVTAPANTPTDYTLSFAPILAADQLISISGGQAQEPEGGGFTLDVDYVGGATQQIFSQSAGSLTFFNLSTIANRPFAPGTINGLTFHLQPPNNFLMVLSIPAGTQFTFNGAAVDGRIPEPGSLALLMAGGAVGLLNWRRRRDVPQDTSEWNSAYLPPGPRAIGSQ